MTPTTTYSSKNLKWCHAAAKKKKKILKCDSLHKCFFGFKVHNNATNTSASKNQNTVKTNTNVKESQG
jgi:hypothetical protein